MRVEGAKPGFEYDSTCKTCGAPARRPFIIGKGKRSVRQRPKWRVCDNGHKFILKRGQV